MWRYNAQRCAASPEQLPAELNLQWVRELAPPKPAWPASQDRLQFDGSYEPVVAGKTIFVGSMVSDSVTAYDTETGAEKWRFYCDGPVRFAPVAYNDKLYFASDDGYLYACSAENGSLISKFLAGPATNKVIGNDRLVGMWPVRGGPVLYDETIYFAASIWPFMGTFIHAIDAGTGDILWTNSGSGSTYLMQPHSSPAFAGVAPQGYLVATEDKLLVAGGRSVPAAYDRKTGKFLYYHLNKYGKMGVCKVMASGDYFFNDGSIYKLSDGIGISRAPASVIANDVIIGMKSNAVVAYQLDPGAKRAKDLGATEALPQLERIHMTAGSRVYGSGEDGTIMAVDIPVENSQAEVSWQAKVDGEVWNMLAADGRLFVITLEGSLYCFAEKKTEPKRYALEPKSLPVRSEQWADKAKQILEMTDEKDGYCLLPGLGSGGLLYELISQSNLYVIALDPDAEKVAAIRRQLNEAGLYGNRVSVHVGDITTMRLAPYMANLVVSEDLQAAGSEKGDVFIERVYHSLRPYGGTACFSVPQSKHIAIFSRTFKSELPGCEIASSGKFIRLTRVGPLPDSADWTHQYGDSANTVMSYDKSVKAPLGLLWFGGPSNDKILPRHGHGPSPQVVAGRLFIEGRNMIRAVDVYTGRLLWERQFEDLGKFYDNTSHQPGANEIGSNYVTVSDAVYIVYGDNIHVLDPATGRTTKEFSIPGQDKPNFGSLAVWEDLLLATSSPLHVPLTDGKGRIILPKDSKPIIDKGADWQYLAGANPGSGWAQPDFKDIKWKTSAAGFGYSDDDIKTTLKNMRNRYSTVYLRSSFNLPEPGKIAELGLVVKYDDAFIAYLNGREILRVGVTSGSGSRASGVGKHEADNWEYFRIDNHATFLRAGTNVLAIEGHNEKIGGSDFCLHPYLVTVTNGKSGIDRSTGSFALNNITGVTLNADYASGSKMLVAMDRHTGSILWRRSAEHSFRHNAIAMAAGKVFCIDGISDTKLATLRRRGLNFDNKHTLYALDARTGELIWQANEGVFGTWLAYSTEHDVLLEAGSRSGDRANDEVDKGMTAYRGTDGKVLWRTDDKYKGPPIIYHDRIITQTGGGSGSAAAEAKVFDLLSGKYVTREHAMTGETIPWTWVRFKGCNTAIASENLLTFRSASGAFVDLTKGQGTASIGGFKSGCTSNLIIANGVLNAPDYTRTCVCSYQNQASLALIHMPEVGYWTFDYYLKPSEPTPVKQVGINFGAPGNRYTENGTLWLEFPSVGGPSPDIPVRARYDNPKWFRHHSSRVEGENNWIAASGVTGLREVAVRMFIQPGRNPSSVDAFDKHIEKIPTWSEEQIKGAFEQPRPYTVRLYFAETEEYEIGERLFNVSIQGRQALEAFDIVKEAGGINRSVVKEFKGINVTDDLRITLTPAAGQAAPLLCGIEIIAEGW
ncbi:MAG TPA: PQQ-binding-like beta-propeller repeat protein [Sedimentisphaerales bacterium]|nr:PQQ-binding-like beta-propeller repeat protein [Sedimentisphaerales bacterium]